MMAASLPRKQNFQVDIAVVCALDLEAAPFVRRLKRRRKTKANRFEVTEGMIAERRVAVVRAARNSTQLAAAVDALLVVHRPRWVIAAGFAVGLNEKVRRGDIVLASELVRDGQRSLAVNLRLTTGEGTSRGLRSGRLVCVSRLPRTVAQKRSLGEHSGASVADQQSHIVAKVCAEHGTKFLSARIVLDDVSGDTPTESRLVLHPSFSFRAGGMFGAVLGDSKRPGNILKLRRTALEHAGRLAAFLESALPSFD